jgi:hypothetical protein
MRALLLSSVLYLMGIAIVLFLRPPLMFHQDGRWKEFGLRDDDSSVFPFWMFCLVWALISFFIGRVFFSEEEGGAASVARSAAVAASVSAAPQTLASRLADVLPEREDADEMPVPAPPSRNNAKKRNNGSVRPPAEPPAPMAPAEANGMRPGYYRLNKEATRRTGVPKYIYVGEEPPEVSDDED